MFQIQEVEARVNRSRQELLEKQKSLRLSEEKYRSLFEFAPDGIVISTISGRILSYNRSFLQMFQLNEEQVASLSAKDLYVDLKTRERIMAELLRNGSVQNLEVTLKRMDGTELPALLSQKLISAGIMAGEINAEEDQDVLIEAIIRDISSRKEVEKQLIQAQKMESVGLLAGGVAHDFNNLLAGIMGYASLIVSQTNENSELRRYAETIEHSATRASELTQKLLAFARGGKYKIEVINLNEIVDEVAAFLSRTLEKNITLSKELAPDLFFVEADPSQMSQVLLNLCVNARDAMPSGGELLIKTFNTSLEEKISSASDRNQPGRYVAITVADTGTGMDEDILPRIFDPFFSTKERGKGTGLGLSMVYGIVKNHGGYIDVESKPGVGTTFTVYLPATDIKTKIVKERKEVEVAGGSETILLIDDEQVVRDLGKAILEEKGYTVLLARDGEEGISAFQTHRDQIDLVLLDMIMPKKDGVEVYRALKRIDPDVKVVLVSGYSLNEKAQEILNDGALKPPLK